MKIEILNNEEENLPLLQRTKHIAKKVRLNRLFIDSLYFLPSLLVFGICIALSPLTYGLSILGFFPGFIFLFTAFQRISNTVSGYGDSNYTFKKGYNDFFKKGSFFSIFKSMLVFLIVYNLVNFFLSLATIDLIGLYDPTVATSLRGLNVSDFVGGYVSEEANKIFAANLDPIARVIQLIRSLSLYLPMILCIAFISSDMQKVFLASYISPVIDKQLGVFKKSLGKSFIKSVKSDYIKGNLISGSTFFVCFSLIYGLLTWAVTYIIPNSYVFTSFIGTLPLILSLVVCSFLFPIYFLFQFSYLLAMMPEVYKHCDGINKANILVTYYTQKSFDAESFTPFYNYNITEEMKKEAFKVLDEQKQNFQFKGSSSFQDAFNNMFWSPYNDENPLSNTTVSDDEIQNKDSVETEIADVEIVSGSTETSEDNSTIHDEEAVFIDIEADSDE